MDNRGKTEFLKRYLRKYAILSQHDAAAYHIEMQHYMAAGDVNIAIHHQRTTAYQYRIAQQCLTQLLRLEGVIS